jgi:hypothetical protein
MHVFNPWIPSLEIINIFKWDEDDENTSSIHGKMVAGQPAMAVDDT